MKTILMSIKPKWCELIASGKKTIEACRKVIEWQTEIEETREVNKCK